MTTPIVYGSATAYTITLASLASGSQATSSAVQNTGGALDIQVQVSITTGASGVSSTGYVSLYAEASLDGTTYDVNLKGSRLLGTLQATAASTTYTATFSLSAAFGGFPPNYHKIVVDNETGAALAASGNAATYATVSQ